MGVIFSISGGVFVMCHFCKVPLFSNGIKGCDFCWVYLMVVKLLPVLEESLVAKHEISIV